MFRWGVFFLSYWLSTAALAQDKPSSQPSQQQAAASFGRGDALFRGGKESEKAGKLEEAKSQYLKAASEFDEANQAYPDATFLYNAGICFMRAGLDGEAYTKFREYLTAYPAAPNRDEVQQYVGQLALANPGLITKVIQSPNRPPELVQPTSMIFVPGSNPTDTPPSKGASFCHKNKVACFVAGGVALGAAGVGTFVFGWTLIEEPNRDRVIRGPKP